MRQAALRRARWRKYPPKRRPRELRGAEPDYGPAWPRQAARARKRDKGRCVGIDCGRKPEKWEPQHPVHHIIALRLWADQGKAHNLVNLATTCPGCHARLLTPESHLLHGDMLGFWRGVSLVLPEVMVKAAWRMFCTEEESMGGA